MQIIFEILYTPQPRVKHSKNTTLYCTSEMSWSENWNKIGNITLRQYFTLPQTFQADLSRFQAEW